MLSVERKEVSLRSGKMVVDVVTSIAFDHDSREHNGLDLLPTQHRTHHVLILDQTVFEFDMHSKDS